MADLKREYVVPLRRKTRMAPKWRRSKKAVTVLKEFMQKHMKTEEVIVGTELNEFIWAHGGKYPPGKVSVIALRTEMNGVQKTLVNLATVGVDKQMQGYAQAKKQAKAAMEKAMGTDESEAKSDVKDAEVTEVEEKKEAPAKKAAKKAAVKEAKNNE